MLRAAADATWFSENNDKCHVGYRTKSQNSVCGRSECEPCPQILKLNIFVRSFFLVRRTYVQVTYLLCFLLPFRVFNVISAITNGDLHLTFWRSKSLEPSPEEEIPDRYAARSCYTTNHPRGWIRQTLPEIN